MEEDFWTRAQAGERAYWLTDRARRLEGDAEKRRDFWGRYLDIIRRRRPFRPGDRVLDVGCGPAGILTAVEDFCERYGVDPLMDFYREQYPLSTAIHYSRQMGERLDFSDGFFQVACCINVLDHTRRPAEVCRELARVLAPGGYLLIEEDVFRGLEYYRKRFKRWTRLLRGRIEKHPHTFRAADVERMACDVGLHVVERFLKPKRRHGVLTLILNRS